MQRLIAFFVVLFSFAIYAGTLLQEQRQFFTTEQGLEKPIMSLHILGDNTVYAVSTAGISSFDGDRWAEKHSLYGLDILDARSTDQMLQVLVRKNQGYGIVIVENGDIRTLEFKDFGATRLVAANYLAVGNKIYAFDPTASKLQSSLKFSFDGTINEMIVMSNGDVWLASDRGLFYLEADAREPQPVYPTDGLRSWAPRNVNGLALDKQGFIWFASSQGVGSFDGEKWSLYTGADGLPYNQFTCAAAGDKVWFGTDYGAIWFDGHHWAYRQGKRWLPDDRVNDIAVDANGAAWIATDGGVSRIEFEPMTLAEKAKWYEDEIDRYHRRTPFGYVLEVTTGKPGDKSEIRKHDSDNDGLWTSMYGAGECYAWAATHDPKARERAHKAFEALEFLGKVTQGGSHPAPPGFVARTILPVSGPNPNDGRLERDRKTQQHDKLWKVIDPRWPVSEDSVWYWKCDTSSDELDGHYYFYGLYYDLVAETEEEKQRVRDHVRALTDHLVAHDYQLVDHDGLPTRWARFNPYEINHDKNWVFDRNLNSLSMLSYLLTAAHITGDEGYIKYAEYLVENHGYLQNAQLPKTQRGIGTGNQSDDEMALMCLYNFIKYSPNPEWTSRMALALWTYGRMELPEMNPFFNYVYAAMCAGKSFSDAWGTHELEPTGPWQEDALETLQRFPLDRFDWRHDNSKRIDIMPIEDIVRHFDEGSYANRGRRVNGKVIPVDECHFNHWNRDPYDLITGGSGRGLADGAVFLLPYYMGLYHGFIE